MTGYVMRNVFKVWGFGVLPAPPLPSWISFSCGCRMYNILKACVVAYVMLGSPNPSKLTIILTNWGIDYRPSLDNPWIRACVRAKRHAVLLIQITPAGTDRGRQQRCKVLLLFYITQVSTCSSRQRPAASALVYVSVTPYNSLFWTGFGLQIDAPPM